MKVLKSFVVTVTVFCLLIVIYSSSSFALQSEKNSGISENELTKLVQKNLKFRETIGYNTDSDYVKGLVRDYHKKQQSGLKERLGYVYTEEEFDALMDRLNMQQKNIPEIKEYIKQNKSMNQTFGGMYIDQKNSGTVHIGFTKTLTEDQKLRIRNMYPDKNKIMFFDAVFTERQRADTIELINTSRESMEEIGIVINKVSTDLKKQQIVIGIENPAPQKIEYLQNKFGGDIIEIVRKQASLDEATSFTKHHDPLTGGLAIEKLVDGGSSYDLSSNSADCSSGFLAQDKLDIGKALLVTAGHCMMDYPTHAWYQGGTSTNDKIGDSLRHVYGGSTDAGAIELQSWSMTSYYVYGYGDFEYMNIKTVGGFDDTVGDIVCISRGNYNSVDCGEILDTNASGNFGDAPTYFSGLISADYEAEPGDSGSTIFHYSNKELLGIHKGGDSPEYYTHIQHVIDDLDVTPLIGGS